MDRSTRRRRPTDKRGVRRLPTWLQLALLVTILPSLGCTAMATAMWIARDGANVTAEFSGLRKKRVVVVCRPRSSLHYSSSSAAKELSKQVSRQLAKKIRKIDIVDSRDVDAWIDENQWDEYVEVGEAMDAEMVVGIDLDSFKLFESQTLYQGSAIYSIRVFDLADGGEVVYEKNAPEALYPPNSAIDTAQMIEAEFRRRFVADLAEQITRHFYDHDSRVDFAKDSDAGLE